MQTITIPPDSQQQTQNTATGQPSLNDAIGASDNTKLPPLDFIPGQKLDTGQNTGGVALGSIVEARIFVELIDALIPALLIVLLHYAGVKVGKPEMQLTEKQKTTLAPLVEKCMLTLMLNLNDPWAMLGISLVAMYGSNVVANGGIEIINKAFVKEGKPIPEKAKAEAAKTTGQPGNVVKMESPGASFNKLETTFKQRLATAKSQVASWLPDEADINATKKQYMVGYDRAVSLLRNRKAKAIAEGKEEPINKQ